MASAVSQSHFVSPRLLSSQGIKADAAGGTQLYEMPLMSCADPVVWHFPFSIWSLEVPRRVAVGHDFYLRVLWQG